MGLSPVTLGSLVRAEQVLRSEADPLQSYRCASWANVELARALGGQPRPLQVLWHAGNKGSKSTGGLSITVAMCQGREALHDWDGTPVPLPVIAPPVHWALGVESYKIAAGSTTPIVRAMLGKWPKHEDKVGGSDYIGAWHIKHRLSRTGPDDRSDWSRLFVYPYDGPEPEAVRLDGWQIDEPPPYRFLDALRNRGKRGRPLFGFLTLTPIKRSEWEPIFADFPTEHRVAKHGRIRLQSSIYDNRSLTPQDIADAEDQVRNSPYRQARLYGDPVDIADTCPFDTDRLVELRGEAMDGDRYGADWVLRDDRNVLYAIQHGRGMLECWGWPKENDLAVFFADPSSGVRDPDKTDAQQPRNPAGLVGLSLQGNCDFLRFNGYVRPHELGQLAKASVNRCPHWVLVHETNGGWGDAFLRGFRDSPTLTQGELWFDRDPITGKPAAEPGWTQSTSGLGKTLSALQRAFEDGVFRVHSRAAIDNFLRTRIDEKERWDRGDGKGPHGEDVIVYGGALYVMERSTLPRAKPPIERFRGNATAFIPAGDNGPVQERW